MGKLAKYTRRAFLIGATAVAGGVAVGYYFYQRPYPNPLEKDLKEGEATFNPYVKIDGNGKITIITARAEMGQGVTTTLAALVAEELHVDLDKVNIEHGPAGWAYYNTAALEESVPFPSFDRGTIANMMRVSQSVAAKFLGVQGTGGSSSIIDGFDKMRQAGAAAREMLIAAAAKKLGEDASYMSTKNGVITHSKTGKTVTFAEVAADAARMDPPSSVTLSPPKNWLILGKSQPRRDIPAKVNGTAQFGIDVDLPDMLHATVRMSPRFGAKMKSYNADKAKSMPGVKQIINLETGIAVVADNTWRAFKAAEAVDIEWETASYPPTSDGIFHKLSEAHKMAEDGWTLRNEGDVDAAQTTVTGEYRAPYLAHACMEPMNATAQFKDNKLTIWTGTQAPTMLQLIGARETGVEADDVVVNTTLLGGGFGRRFEVDFATYAIRIAKKTDGKPVKVTWTREEDITHDAYRPAAVARFKAGFDKDDQLETLSVDVATQPILPSLLARTFPDIPAAGPDRTTIEGAFDQPYGIKNYRARGVPVPMDIPVGFWRSVGNSQNAFFHECIIDELAASKGHDPLDMRLKLMKDHKPAIGVLEKVAKMSGWRAGKPPKGKGRGLAFCLSFGAWVAQVVEVEQRDDAIAITNVWCAADVGVALDPVNVEAQLQSGIIFGLSAAMMQEVTFKDGGVEQQNFDTYDAMRLNQAPKIQIAIHQTAPRMSGIGEPGTPPAAPALANAVFNLTGKRVRTLPLGKEVEFVEA